MTDFRSLAGILENRGELVRISREVDPRFEMPALMEQVERQRRAFLFERVKGSPFPVIGGLLNRIECYGWGIGEPQDKPFGQAEMDLRIESAKGSSLAPVTVEQGTCQEVVLTGEQARLGLLPVPTFFEHDSGPFITSAVGIARNPATGEQNVGIYRTLIIDDQVMVVNASSLSDLRRLYAQAEQSGEPMDLALAIGVEPALLVAASCKLPPDQSEIGVAGALQGRPIELVKCRTNDLMVPANAEIVIEGRVDFSQRIENTLGEFAGQYGPETAPVSRVTAITHRRDAMFYSILAGKNPEHNTLGAVATYSIQRAISGALRAKFPQIRGLNVFLDPGLGAMVHLVISISKQDDAEPAQLIRDVFAAHGGFFPMSHITKRVIVVDDDINVHDMRDVDWAIWSRVARAEKFMVIPDVESWELERCAKDGKGSLRVGIDATMDMEDREKLMRPLIPGADVVRLEDYLKARKQTAA
ncbi:MAG: UbiD family decarboxylase [Chromatiales bacterium]|nr:UbiD family decarboxylase [Chromatiales bacterium]